jgi:hypothetical protein
MVVMVMAGVVTLRMVMPAPGNLFLDLHFVFFELLPEEVANGVLLQTCFVRIKDKTHSTFVALGAPFDRIARRP